MQVQELQSVSTSFLSTNIEEIKGKSHEELTALVNDLAKKNLDLQQENQHLATEIQLKDQKITDLKGIIEPSINSIMENLTERLVKMLMGYIPEFRNILENSTKANGTVCLPTLTTGLEHLQTTFQTKESSSYTVAECHLLDPIDDINAWGNTQQDYTPDETIITLPLDTSELDKITKQLHVLRELFETSSEMQEISSEKFIFIDGKKLDQKNAIIELYNNIEIITKGGPITWKTMVFAFNNIMTISKFLGLGLLALHSPWTAAFMLLGKFSYKTARWFI